MVELERLFDSVLFMRTASVRFHTSDELEEMDLLYVEGLLYEVQSMRSRLDGQEATLHSAIGVLRGGNGPQPPRPRPHPGPDAGADSADSDGSDSDSGSGSGSDDGGAGSGPNNNTGGGPSGRAERERLARVKRLEAHPDVAEALNAGLISTEQADAIMKASLPADAKRQLLAGAMCETTDETLAAIKTAILAADEGDAERKFRRQRNRRKGLCGVDEHGMTWININFDPIIGAAFKEMFDREVRRQFQIDKLEPNPLKLRSPRKIGADACAVLFGVSPEDLTIQNITNTTTAGTNATPETAASEDAGSDPAGGSVARPHSQNGWNGGGESRSGGYRVNLTMDLSMFGDPKASAYTQDGEPVPASILNNILCKSEILLWITDSTSQHPGKYQLATAEPYATEIQKQGLTIRDGCCVWKGCNMRATRCDAHHLTFRRHGGKTDICNLALACPTHHTRLHQMKAHLRPGNRPHQWVLEQDLTRQQIDKWTNPPPQPPPKPGSYERRTGETEHHRPDGTDLARTNDLTPMNGCAPNATVGPPNAEPARANGKTSTRRFTQTERIEPEPIDLPPRW